MYERIIVLYVNDLLQVAQQHFVFSEKYLNCFFQKSHDFAYLCDFITKFGYTVTQVLIVWSTWKYFLRKEFNEV